MSEERKKLEEILSDPEKLEKLEKLLENVEKLERALDGISPLLDRLELYQESGMIDEFLGVIFGILSLQRGFLKEEHVKAMAELIQAFAFVGSPECMEEIAESVEKEEKLGLTGLFGKLRDPDVQRGLGLVMNLLKALGGCSTRHKIR